jgi:hypothetical protein
VYYFGNTLYTASAFITLMRWIQCVLHWSSFHFFFYVPKQTRGSDFVRNKNSLFASYGQPSIHGLKSYLGHVHTYKHTNKLIPVLSLTLHHGNIQRLHKTVETLKVLCTHFFINMVFGFNIAAVLPGIDSHKFWTASSGILCNSSCRISSSCFRHIGDGNLFLS